VEWLPAQHPPVRYLEGSQGLCVTVQNGIVQKATLAEDPVGLPYVSSIGRRVLPLDRSLRVERHSLILKDRETELTLPLDPALPVKTSPRNECPVSPVDWRTVLAQGVLKISPAEAFEAVPLFPEDDQEIGELAAQSFVADYLDDLGEQEAADTCEASLESRELYDLIYQWLPYDSFDSSITMRTIVTRLRHMLQRGGEAFVVGPVHLGELLTQEPSQLLVHWEESVASLPTFLMHKTILPKARVQIGLTLFHVRRI
ncbi:MAG: hypothetical protein ABL983_10090, partial [Nitrospira sp.]